MQLTQDQETGQFKPWSPVDVEATTEKMVKGLMTGSMTQAGVMKMFNAAVKNTPEEEKVLMGPHPDVMKNMYSTEFSLHNPKDDILNYPGGYPPLGGYIKGNKMDNAVFKDVLDSSISGGVSGGGVLARVDLIPQIFIWLLTQFPALARVARVPANGLNHTWNNLLDLGDATDGFIDEFGCPLPSKGTYFRGQSNIAILAVERGTSLKLEAAVKQSGMTYDGNMTTYDLEMRNAVWSRAKIFQACVYRGTTASGHTGTDQYGKTFLNGFNGLRVLLSENANTVHSDFYPSPYSPVIVEQAVSGTITDAIDAAAGLIMNNGGQPTAVHMSVNAARKLRGEATPFVRYMMNDATSAGFVLGGHVRAIDTVAGELPIVVVPGNAIGTYDAAGVAGSRFSSGTFVEDIYVLSEPFLSFPYLLSPDPLPIEIPLGIPDASGLGCLVRKFIIYWMMGFAVHIPIYQAKVRIAAA